MDRNRIFFIVRMIVGSMLLIGIYHEAGIFTASSLGLIFTALEIIAKEISSINDTHHSTLEKLFSIESKEDQE